jgi:hypothetical protein
LLALALAAAAAASPAPACELHVFTSGPPAVPKKGTPLVRVLAPSADPLAMVNLVSPAARISDLSDGEIRGALGLPDGYSVGRHSDRIIDPRIRDSAAPLLAPAPPCYAELAAYEALAMPANRSRTGRDEIEIRFLYREFDGGKERFRADASGYAAIRALHKTAKTDRAAALADLKAGSRELIADFGRKLAKKRARAAAAR